MQTTRCLVTGAAGFIGSHIVDRLIDLDCEVIGIDNFSTGKRQNIQHDIKFIEGDVRSLETCKKAVFGIDVVFHEAALGSVPRSIEEPLVTHDNNVNGTLNMLFASLHAGVKRFVYAASSSAYGNTDELPKREELPTKPMSPYAVSKLVGEHYCSVFNSVYGLPTISLRYFNVFGPRQNPESQYAAVIPKFFSAISKGEPVSIYGDGGQSRDFTYVSNVVDANIAAMHVTKEAFGESMNIGGGERVTINRLAIEIAEALDKPVVIGYKPKRSGDVLHSLAEFSLARRLIEYRPAVDVYEGIKKTAEWWRSR